jgi:SAM-dependent methyltransferase
MDAVTHSTEGIRCDSRPRCAACGGDGRLLHSDLRDTLFGAPGTWNIRRCLTAGCGLAWLDPMPHPDEIGRFYDTYYTHPNSAVAAEVVQADAVPTEAAAPRPTLRGLVRRALGRIIPGRRLQFQSELMHFGSMKPGRMLEVGCGAGQFLTEASAAGWKVLGIDFDQVAVSNARRTPGVDARVMDIFDPYLDAQRFDGIAMNNVIEHLPDPARVFARCKELLAPEGRLVMITPNIDALCHEIFGRNWRGLEVPRHLYLFNAPALRIFAEAAGLTDVHVFCPLNSGEVEFMVNWSEEVARRSNQPKRADRCRLKLSNAFMAVLGRCVGEWVVLIAHGEHA